MAAGSSLYLCGLHCCIAFLLAAVGCVQGYVQFEPVLVPRTQETLFSVQSSSKVTYGRTQRERFYKVARTTENHNCILNGCRLVGEVLDVLRNNVSNFNRDTFGPPPKGVPKVDFSHYPSGGVLLHEEDSDTWFMMYTFEKPNPGTIYRMRVRLENDTRLASKLNVPLNFQPFGGLWKPRVSIPTPTNTMMGAEGIPPDVKLYDESDCMLDKKENDCLADVDPEGFMEIIEFLRYFGVSPKAIRDSGRLASDPRAALPNFRPYRYGFPYEVSLGLNLDDRVVDRISKLYALGRTGAQGIAVMQDGFTVYISGSKGTLLRFVSDRRVEGYVRGELFAATIRLADDSNPFGEVQKGTELKVDWVSLGKTDADSIANLVTAESRLEFADIFDHAQYEGGRCPEGFKPVNYIGGGECLRLLDLQLGAVFETERTAAVRKATGGIFLFSQIATKLDSDRFYIGVSEIVGGNLDLDREGPTVRVTVPPNKCGCVFEALHDEDFTVHTMRVISCGTSDGGDERNQCSTEGIANPRALTYVNAFEYLLIGEDSQNHENNFVWAWDPETEKITRIFHAPVRGKITSLTWSEGVVGGNNYISITIAKPVDTFAWLSYFGSFDLTSFDDMSFSSVEVPYARGPKGLPISFRRVTVGKSELVGSFKELFRTGQKFKTSGKNPAVLTMGKIVDRNYKPVRSYKEGPVRPTALDVEETHHRLGFTSLIDMCGRIYSIAVVDSLPAMSYTVALRKTDKGQLTAIKADYNDWSKWGGLWQSGGGTVSPWNSHVGGEVFEPDGSEFQDFPCLTGFSSCFKSRAENAFEASIKFIRYFNTYFDDLNNKFEKLSAVFNPYSYGYAYEITINKFGCTHTKKLMTLGRFSHGDIEIMPDRRTVYMTDLTTGRDIGGGLFRFIADKPGDLRAGTLYAAKLRPIQDGFEMTWIKLANANNNELVKRSRSIEFRDIFEFIPAVKRCNRQSINVKSTLECIALKKKMQKWAAFFETRRYAALRGASIEFANVKGLTLDKTTNKLFLSISRITRRDTIMLQDDVKGSSNDIKVQTADCGVIYEMTMARSTETEYNAVVFRQAARGTDDFGTIGSNRCNVEGISNPGSMSSIPGHRQLLVAEDSCQFDTRSRGVTCGHENNAVWAMESFGTLVNNRRQREMTRILTLPPQMSLALVDWYPKIGGTSFITVAANELYQQGFNEIVNPNNPGAFFGYVGPFVSEEADQRRDSVKAASPKCNEGTKLRKRSPFQCPKRI